MAVADHLNPDLGTRYLHDASRHLSHACVQANCRRAEKLLQQMRRARRLREQARLARTRAIQHRLQTRISLALAGGTSAGWAAEEIADASLTRLHSLPYGVVRSHPDLREGGRGAPLPSLPEQTSKIYVWGYGPVQSAALRQQNRSSPEARRFAIERGWDETRAGAWAAELSLPLPMSLALAALEPAVRWDAAVIGWGGRAVRPPASARLQPIGRADTALPISAGREGSSFAEDAPPAEFLAQRASAEVAAARALCMATAARLEAARALRAQLAETTRNLDAALARPPVAFLSRHQKRALEMPPHAVVRPRSRELSLPGDEFSALNEVVTHAHDLADAGCLAAGYSVLLAGLHRAEAAAAAGLLWAEALIDIYHLALDNYVARYRLRL